MPDIRVVIFQRDKWWIAQCLEHDLGAQAFTVEDAMYELQRSIMGHIIIAEHHGKRPFADLPKAPRSYWDKFAGTMVKVELEENPSFQAPVRPQAIPRPEVRLAA